VAEALFIDAETVRAHRRLYATAGWAGVERLAHADHAPLLSQAQAAEAPAELWGRVTGPETAACFARIEARDPAARRISPIADNATFNRAAVVREWLARPGCRVRVVDLPPYAPNAPPPIGHKPAQISAA
jgi:hypothetical protein